MQQRQTRRQVSQDTQCKWLKNCRSPCARKYCRIGSVQRDHNIYMDVGKIHFKSICILYTFGLKEEVTLTTFKGISRQLKSQFILLKGQYVMGTWHWVRAQSDTRVITMMSSASRWSRDREHSACALRSLWISAVTHIIQLHLIKITV